MHLCPEINICVGSKLFYMGTYAFIPAVVKENILIAGKLQLIQHRRQNGCMVCAGGGPVRAEQNIHAVFHALFVEGGDKLRSTRGSKAEYHGAAYWIPKEFFKGNIPLITNNIAIYIIQYIP